MSNAVGRKKHAAFDSFELNFLCADTMHNSWEGYFFTVDSAAIHVYAVFDG